MLRENGGMERFGVTLRPGKGASEIALADGFNVATPFIDRHLDEGRAGKAAIRTVHEDVTYGQLAERVNRAGNALLGLGLRRGERVLMIVKDCPAFFYLFWGAIKAGIVPVPLNTLLRAADYAYIVENSGCACVVYSPEYASEVEPALQQSPHKPATVLRTEGTEASLDRMMALAADTLDAVPSKADADCFWLYSSGSTGRPKGAVHLQRDMVYTSQHYGVETLGIAESDVFFSAAKLFFAYGHGNAMTFPLWIGGTAILSDERPSPPMTFGLIEALRRATAGLATGAARSVLDPRLRLRRRGIAGRHLSTMEGENRADHPRRHRLDGSAAHFHFQPSRRRQAGGQRSPRAGI